MKHLSFLRRHANIVFCLLLCLVYQRAESKELFENNSLDTCYVLAIANVDLTTDLQKKYEERNIATSAIVGYSFSDDEVKIYLLDDRYDFDLYSIQKGDTLHISADELLRMQQSQVISDRIIRFDKLKDLR